MAIQGNFRDFVFREQRKDLYWAVGLLLGHFILLKLLFPHAIIAWDTNFYIRAAENSTEILAWPIGYSKFLAFIHLFTHSDWAIVIFQYILLEGAVLYLYFTIIYLLRPAKWTGWIIFICLIFNSFILTISNYVLSDSLFASLTVLWFAVTLWYFHQPKAIYSYLMVLLIFLLFTLRYYAIFYPVITVPIILFSRFRWQTKLMSLALGCLLFFGFIRYTSGLFEKLSGQREFSPFSGWVLAGNTLIMYRHVEHREQDIPPPEMRPLHEMVLQSLDTMPSTDRMPDWGMAYYFTWSLTSPLMIHRHVNLYDNPTNADLKKWASVGGLYKNYAIFLIKKHPLPYVRYYIGQGLDWFIYPVIEFTNEFPEGGSRVKEGVRHWFGYKSTWLSSTSGNLYSLAYIPTVINILHLFMIMGIIAFYFLRIYKKVNTLFRKSIMLAGIYWLANFLFMVVSAPIMLRYHLSIMIVDIAFVPVVWECIYRYMAAKTPQIQPTL